MLMLHTGNRKSMPIYRYTDAIANFNDNYYEKDAKFNYFYDLIYSILLELYDKEFDENLIRNVIYAKLANSDDAYLIHNTDVLFAIIRNTILQYRLYKDQAFQPKPGILSQEAFIAAIQRATYFDKGKEFYVALAAMYATTILLQDFISFCYKNPDYLFTTSSTEYLNALTTYYQQTFNLINNTTMLASYIFGNFATNAFDTETYPEFIKQIIPINVIEVPVYVVRKNNELVLTSNTVEVNSLKYYYSVTVPFSTYFKLPNNIPENIFYETNYRSLYAFFEYNLFSYFNELLYTIAYLSQSYYPDARLQQISQKLNNAIVVSINRNRYVLTFLDIFKAVVLSFYKLLYKAYYNYNVDLNCLLSYSYTNFYPQVFENEYLFTHYGLSYTHKYFCSYTATYNSTTLCNLNSTRDFLQYIAQTLPSDLVNNINILPEFIFINFPAYLLLIDLDLYYLTLINTVYAYLEFYLLYNVIPFRILKYYNLININIPSQPIQTQDYFALINTTFAKNSLNDNITIQDLITKAYYCNNAIINCDYSIIANQCKKYIIENCCYTLRYACSNLPANYIEMYNSHTCFSLSAIVIDTTSYSFKTDILNKQDCKTFIANLNCCSLSLDLLAINQNIHTYCTTDLNNYACDNNLLISVNTQAYDSCIYSNTSVAIINSSNLYSCNNFDYIDNSATTNTIEISICNNYNYFLYLVSTVGNLFDLVQYGAKVIYKQNPDVYDCVSIYSSTDLINADQCNALIQELYCYTFDTYICNTDNSIVDNIKIFYACNNVKDAFVMHDISYKLVAEYDFNCDSLTICNTTINELYKNWIVYDNKYELMFN